jgi:hypothetical protein
MDPEIEARNRRLSEAIRAADPRYEESQIEYDVIAEQRGISEEEARVQFRGIQLMSEGGLEIDLADQYATITFPYWESLDPHALSADIATAVSIIGDATGWMLYDPQLERFSDPVEDAEAFREMFDAGRTHVRKLVEEHDHPPRSFWSRLLRGRS